MVLFLFLFHHSLSNFVFLLHSPFIHPLFFPLLRHVLFIHVFSHFMRHLLCYSQPETKKKPQKSKKIKWNKKKNEIKLLTKKKWRIGRKDLIISQSGERSVHNISGTNKIQRLLQRVHTHTHTHARTHARILETFK